MSCKSTELIPLTDVSDIYNVSTGQETNEFIIRRRQGITVYFSSPSREQIVKVIGISFLIVTDAEKLSSMFEARRAD